MDGWVGGWMAGWMNGWLGGWMDGWMDGHLSYLQTCTFDRFLIHCLWKLYKCYINKYEMHIMLRTQGTWG